MKIKNNCDINTHNKAKLHLVTFSLIISLLGLFIPYSALAANECKEEKHFKCIDVDKSGYELTYKELEKNEAWLPMSGLPLGSYNDCAKWYNLESKDLSTKTKYTSGPVSLVSKELACIPNIVQHLSVQNTILDKYPFTRRDTPYRPCITMSPWFVIQGERPWVAGEVKAEYLKPGKKVNFVMYSVTRAGRSSAGGTEFNFCDERYKEARLKDAGSTISNNTGAINFPHETDWHNGKDPYDSYKGFVYAVWPSHLNAKFPAKDGSGNDASRYSREWCHSSHTSAKEGYGGILNASYCNRDWISLSGLPMHHSIQPFQANSNKTIRKHFVMFDLNTKNTPVIDIWRANSNVGYSYTANTYTGLGFSAIHPNQPTIAPADYRLADKRITFDAYQFKMECYNSPQKFKECFINDSVIDDNPREAYFQSIADDVAEDSSPAIKEKAKEQPMYYVKNKTTGKYVFEANAEINLTVVVMNSGALDPTYKSPTANPGYPMPYTAMSVRAPILFRIPLPKLNVVPSAISTVNREEITAGEKAVFTHAAKLDSYYEDCDGDKCKGEATFTTYGNSIRVNSQTKTLYVSAEEGNLTATHQFNEVFQSTDADAGKTFCRRVNYTYKDIATNQTNTSNSKAVCVTVKKRPLDYKLEPIPTLDGSYHDVTGKLIGDTVKVSGFISKNGTTSSSDAQTWVLSSFRLNKGESVQAIAGGKFYNENSDVADTANKLINDYAPAIFYNVNNSYAVVTSANNQTFTQSQTSVPTNDFIIPNDAKLGDRYCFALSVQPYKNDSNKWRHSRPICIVISKHPSTQVHGSGLVLPSNDKETQQSTYGNIAKVEGKSYGSWIEYDILAAKLASNQVASNAGHLINAGGAAQDKWHQLTIANTPKYGMFGGGISSSRVKTVVAYYSDIANTTKNKLNATGPDIDLSALSYTNQVNYLVPNTSNINLYGSLPEGRSLVIVQNNGQITINGNLTYQKQSGFTKTSDYSQLIVIAKNGNIVINDNVNQVDGWLVATGDNKNQGRLKTCQISKVNADICNKQLVVNGPVIVDYLDLLRTYGGDPGNNTTKEPAEIFNFRPDSYLWALGQTTPTPIYEATYSRELPPRY